MFTSFKDIIRVCEERSLPFWKAVLLDDCRESDISEEASFEKMKSIYLAMKESDANYDPHLRSASKMVGRDAEKLRLYQQDHQMLCGGFSSRVMVRALRVAESNACMKRIVAAPTAGSCGVMPAVLVTVQEARGLSDEEMTRALYVASGIGGIIAARASLAGAEGGCQAEIGSASAMAAGAAVYLSGGDEHAIADSCAMALSNLMGLVCDPVAGLVEVPCVKRNVIGAMNAISSADLALAGIRSQIPADEVVDAMKSVGHMMAPQLRETGQGGLAATPTGQRLCQELMEEK